MSMDKNKKLPNIIQLESYAQEDTKRSHWREIEIFAGILNAFTSGLNYVGSFEGKEDNETEYIWLLLLTRCLHSIRCAINLMLKGYYSQAMSLLRTGTEDWFICGTCQSNEQVRDYLLREKGYMPKYKTLAIQMNVMDVYKGDYNYQSKFTHSSKLSLRVLLDSIAPKYDKMLFLLCAESLVRVFCRMAEYMGRFLSYLDKDKAKAWDSNNTQSFKDATSWLMELREKYGKEADFTDHD